MPEEEEEYQFILRLPPHLAAKINKAYKKKTETNEEEEDSDNDNKEKEEDNNNKDEEEDNKNDDCKLRFIKVN